MIAPSSSAIALTDVDARERQRARLQRQIVRTQVARVVAQGAFGVTLLPAVMGAAFFAFAALAYVDPRALLYAGGCLAAAAIMRAPAHVLGEHVAHLKARAKALEPPFVAPAGPE